MKIDSLLIEKANKAIIKAGIVNEEEGLYDKVFKGYVSSFGASIAQAGLIPTIIFYEATSEQAKDRPKVIKALMQLLDEKYRVDSLAKHLLSKRANMEKKDFEKEEKALLKNVTEAMVGIKLALRLYKEKKQKGTENGEE